ncbi:MAG TPA: LacI family DNA-binding transcriptional regulator [Bauldia sp.]|nr:LacI family DNA-binding transcriptional regulator [Bauldia sp.]
MAEAAGVSIGTVSNVLNGNRPVRPETVAAVEKAMSRLGYVPNHAATTLRKGRSQIIGLVVPDIANPYFGEVAKGAQEAAELHSLSVIVASAGTTANDARQLLLLRSRGVDGLLYAGSEALGENSLAEIARHVPMVLSGADSENLKVDTVVAHDQQGGAKVAAHLAGLGHRNVLVLEGKVGSWTSARRLHGFHQAFDKAGTRVETMRGYFLVEAAREALAADLAKGKPWYTAVFATNDLMAVGAIQALSAAGYRVPEDISVVGYDDVLIASMLRPALTTVVQPARQLGKLGAERLIARIKGDRASGRVRLVLDVDLAVRASTAPPRR